MSAPEGSRHQPVRLPNHRLSGTSQVVLLTSERTERIPRRTWRLAVFVFLTVFLSGTGLSGAAALWSQHATVETTVITGSWTD